MSKFQFLPISCDSSQRCNEQSVTKGDRVTDNYTKQPQTNKQMKNKNARARLILVRWAFHGSISRPIAVKGCKGRVSADGSTAPHWTFDQNPLDASHITSTRLKPHQMHLLNKMEAAPLSWLDKPSDCHVHFIGTETSRRVITSLLKGFCACSWALMPSSHPICPLCVSPRSAVQRRSYATRSLLPTES